MKRCDADQFREMMISLAEPRKVTLNREELNMWWDLLRRVDFPDVRRAFGEWFRDNKFWPTVREISELIEPLPKWPEEIKTVSELKEAENRQIQIRRLNGESRKRIEPPKP